MIAPCCQVLHGAAIRRIVAGDVLLVQFGVPVHLVADVGAHKCVLGLVLPQLVGNGTKLACTVALDALFNQLVLGQSLDDTLARGCVWFSVCLRLDCWRQPA